MKLIERKTSCSLIIPLYNHKNTLLNFNKEIVNLLVDLENKINVNFKIIYIDDGSRDKTSEVLLELNNIVSTSIVVLDKNYGQTTAISIGLKVSYSDCVIIKSADDQDPIKLIEESIKKFILCNQDVIFYRNKRQDEIYNQINSKIYYTLIRLIDRKIPKGGFDFVLLKKDTIEKLNERFYSNRFLQLDIINSSDSFVLIPYTRIADVKRKSSWTFAKKTKYFFDSFKVIFGFYKYNVNELNRIVNASKIYRFN